MNVILEKLAPGTIFTYRGMNLRKGSLCGPCDPATNKPGRAKGDGTKTEYGRACDLKIGGQWQTDPDLQVWVPDTANVEVS